LAAAQMELPPFDDAEATYREVASLAEQHRLDVRAARAWVALVFVLGRRQRRLDDADVAAGQAEAAVRRAGNPRPQRIRLHQAQGALALSRGDYEAARRSFESAHAATDGDEDPLVLGRSHNNLGAAAARGGRYEDAVEEFAAAVSQYQRVLGPEHPEIADVLHNLGVMQRQLKRYDEADQTLRRVLKIRRDAFGEQHDKTAASLQALGNLEFMRGNYDAARDLLSQALAVVEALGGLEEEKASMLDSLGAIAHRKGEQAEARTYMRKALLIRQEQLGDEHPLIARSQNNLARVLLDDDELAEAVNLLETAKRTLVRTFGEEHGELVAVLENLGDAYARTGRHAEAADAWRHVVRIVEMRDGPDANALLGPLLHIARDELDAKRPDAAEDPLRRAAALAEGDAEATAEVEELRRRLAAGL
jgi:tetratricopeptide (TPR) repeat protein